MISLYVVSAGCIFVTYDSVRFQYFQSTYDFADTLKCTLIFVVEPTRHRMQIHNKSARNQVCFCILLSRHLTHTKVYTHTHTCLFHADLKKRYDRFFFLYVLPHTHTHTNHINYELYAWFITVICLNLFTQQNSMYIQFTCHIEWASERLVILVHIVRTMWNWIEKREKRTYIWKSKEQMAKYKRKWASLGCRVSKPQVNNLTIFYVC